MAVPYNSSHFILCRLAWINDWQSYFEIARAVSRKDKMGTTEVYEKFTAQKILLQVFEQGTCLMSGMKIDEVAYSLDTIHL